MVLLKSLKFLEAVAYVVTALVVTFTDYKLEAGVVLAVVLSVLKLFGVVPELKSRGLW